MFWCFGRGSVVVLGKQVINVKASDVLVFVSPSRSFVEALVFVGKWGGMAAGAVDRTPVI